MSYGFWPLTKCILLRFPSLCSLPLFYVCEASVGFILSSCFWIGLIPYISRMVLGDLALYARAIDALFGWGDDSDCDEEDSFRSSNTSMSSFGLSKSKTSPCLYLLTRWRRCLSSSTTLLKPNKSRSILNSLLTSRVVSTAWSAAAIYLINFFLLLFKQGVKQQEK